MQYPAKGQKHLFNACTVPSPLLRIVTVSLNLLILTGSWRGMLELWLLSVKKKKEKKTWGLEILISFPRIMKLMSEWQSVFQTPTLITKDFSLRWRTCHRLNCWISRVINLQIQQIQSGFLVCAVFIVLYFIEKYSHKERIVCESVVRQKKVVLMSSSDLKCYVTIFNAHN